MFDLVKNMYLMGRMTADQVWAAVEKQLITRDQAIAICGPRET